MIYYFDKVRECVFKGDDKGAIDLLEDYCSKNDRDVHARFLLAFLLVNTQVYADGFLSAIDLLKYNLTLDPSHGQSLILLAYVDSEYDGGIREDVNCLLEKCLMKNDVHHFRKYLFLLSAEYYSVFNRNKYIFLLHKSIEEDPVGVYNYIYLGRVLRDKTVFNIGINNIKVILAANDATFDALNFEDFCEENIRGSRMTAVNYYGLKEEMNRM
ncbi:hypothetical protein [Chitinophaga sp. sic0106]|uniref:hypothetical protein n=1 Tax=Chitinophaga sp. sic0106 TaxID=2854785 RepID=UPI001C46DC2F|nr:hypothetical protein [Chitinophaga sp. sic0106]MBV7529420.1 hypothetical protein [Chitinophaga sp. sic0106]